MDTPTSDRQLGLRGGRLLGYTEYGVPTGTPVLYFHGFPSSRLDWRLFHDENVLAALDVRLIAPDRPGYRLSDFQRGRKPMDWPSNVLAVADRLGIGRFSVLGISSGGPYAVVCAAMLGDRLHKAGVVCGMGAANAPNVRDGASWSLPSMNPLMRRLMLRLTTMDLNRDPARFLDQSRVTFSEPDRLLLDDSKLASYFIDGIRESFRDGITGANHEAVLYTRPWGFSLLEIPNEVHLWHGRQDNNVSAAVGRFMADAMPNCHATFLEDEGHFTLPRNHLADILQVLVS